MEHTFTDDDVGKSVENESGEEIGIVAAVEAETAYVKPSPGLVDSIKAAIGWESDTDDARPLRSDAVARVTDDTIRLEGGSPGAATTGMAGDDEAIGDRTADTGRHTADSSPEASAEADVRGTETEADDVGRESAGRGSETGDFGESSRGRDDEGDDGTDGPRTDRHEEMSGSEEMSGAEDVGDDENLGGPEAIGGAEAMDDDVDIGESEATGDDRTTGTADEMGDTGAAGSAEDMETVEEEASRDLEVDPTELTDQDPEVEIEPDEDVGDRTGVEVDPDAGEGDRGTTGGPTTEDAGPSMGGDLGPADDAVDPGTGEESEDRPDDLGLEDRTEDDDVEDEDGTDLGERDREEDR